VATVKRDVDVDGWIWSSTTMEPTLLTEIEVVACGP